MIEKLLKATEDESLPQLCQRLGEFLELDGPAPPAALMRAVHDPSFAADLVTSRGAPGFLQALFDDPRTTAFAPAAEPAAAPAASNRQLVGRAAEALVRWGRAGFSTVDQRTLERREDACLACPNLRDPQATVQRIVPGRASDRVGSRTGRKVCGLCGCNVSRKIRLPSEACPGEHPTQSGMTRWGEPIGEREREEALHVG